MSEQYTEWLEECNRELMGKSRNTVVKKVKIKPKKKRKTEKELLYYRCLFLCLSGSVLFIGLYILYLCVR